MRAPRFTDKEKDVALGFLLDGASYRETARTLGRAESTIIYHLPGYGWPKSNGRIAASFNIRLDNV